MSTPGPDGEEVDPWTYPEPKSEVDLAKRRESGIHALTHPDGLPGVNVLLLLIKRAPTEEPIVFTCDTCWRTPICKLAFDPYNTDGDCLWDK